MPGLSLSTLRTTSLRLSSCSAVPNQRTLLPFALIRDVHVRHTTTRVRISCRPKRLRTCACQSHKVSWEAGLFLVPKTFGSLTVTGVTLFMARDGTSFAACFHLSRHEELAYMQVPGANSSVSLGTQPSRTAGYRHALFNDFNLTEPFGIVNAVAGTIGLLVKVEACPKRLPAICNTLCPIASDVATLKMHSMPFLYR